MKVQKGLMTLATLSLLALSVACNSGGGGSASGGGTVAVSDRYQEGFDAGKASGYKEGYDVGYKAGDTAGYDRAKAYFQTADYNKGFADGNTKGQKTGYDLGYTDGKADGKSSAGDVTAAYNNGYNDGKKDGYNTGYTDGTKDGYDLGYKDGTKDGYDLGYTDGHKDGYDVGYADGYKGLSVGPTQKLPGYANLLSLLHNDLIDYSKIKAPEVNAKGIFVNGKLLFSESSITSKDTLKRQAVVEEYLVVEMAKQVQGKFGLSADRSLKVAKAANHFRKYSSQRALTAEDTNAYATELIGANVSTIVKAYENSMKGDISGYQSVMQAAAAKNETSPEKMSQIVTELFL
jgi:flagellar biosynthesis/type III secretory pathway protein FliH